MRGKRLRARHRLVPLLGAAPCAYALWRARGEALPVLDGGVVEHAQIVALVAGTDGIDATLASLAATAIVAHRVDGARGVAALADVIDWSVTRWVLPITAGDRISPHAGAAYRAAIAQGARGLVYADDDLLEDDDNRHVPHLKPDWNAELFRHHDYLTGAAIIPASASSLCHAQLAGTAWATSLVGRALADAATPVHLPYILHHRRTRPAPQCPRAAPVAPDASVSVIIPTRNKLDLLRACLDGLARTRYRDLEIIVVDNGSDESATLAYLTAIERDGVRVLRRPGPFNFAALNNDAANISHGSLLCLMNNDVVVRDPDWLATLAAQAVRDDVGAVGPRLIYPDGRIQHAGVVLGIGGAAAHAHRFLDPSSEGYFQRHNLPQFVSAVTAACLVVRADRFRAVGGFDTQAFPVAFNDVDFCLRLAARGWTSLYEPRAELVHYESVSRGDDLDRVGAARFALERAALVARYHTDTIIDPWHHPQLSLFSEQFVIAI